MAILIERTWNSPNDKDVEENSRVTAALLPSKQILVSSDDYDSDQAEDLKETLNNYMQHARDGADPMDEDGIFMLASLARRNSSASSFFLVEDPQEARQLIAEAGLK